MKNLVSIVEIPAIDFERARRFYESVLDISIEAIAMEGAQMGLFPCDAGSLSVVLLGSQEYSPSASGVTAYLNAGNDLQAVAEKVAANGGTITVPKTFIAPESGYFALFIDTEGNRLGLHSPC